MKNVLCLMAATLVTSSIALASTHPEKLDPKYFEIGEVQVQEVNPTTLKNRFFERGAIGSSTCDSSGSRLFLKPSDLTGIATGVAEVSSTLDQIINLGKKVWDLVQAGKPVVKLNSDVATALPAGSKCWLDLQGWSAPQSKAFTVSYKNLYGIEVVRLSYRVIWVYGGSVDGQGNYIGYAAIDPAEVNVAWGFNVDAHSSVPAVYNMGTKQAPVAGMNLKMDYTITPILGIKHIQASQAYFINGLGEFRVLQ